MGQAMDFIFDNCEINMAARRIKIRESSIGNLLVIGIIYRTDPPGKLLTM